MGFNPLKEKGRPMDKQLRDWSELNIKPYDKNTVHPYTQTRVILMNGIEVEGIMFGHQLHRHSDDMELRRLLAMTRRVEQQQQKMINWLAPADASVLEITIGYEQVAVDLTSWLARTEPDPHVKAALDYALLEDFDHLYRYANLLEMVQGKKAEEIVGEYTEIMPGRPTILEHQFPADTVRRPGKPEADILTKLHILTIVAGEQQTMNFYMNIGNRPEVAVGRGLYQEIAMIEEQHVTHYGSLIPPSTSWFERLLLHEYNECWMYYSCLEDETDKRIKDMWESHLADEITHLQSAAELLKKYEGKDPEEILPKELPDPMKFESNIEYVREVLEQQEELTAREDDYLSREELDKDDRYFAFQGTVNQGKVPSQSVITARIKESGEDYRQELAGEHPVERLRPRKKATV